MKRILLSIALAAFACTASIAQDIDPVEEIISQASDQDAAELNAAAKSLANATQMLEEADKSMQNVQKLKSEASSQKKGKQKKTLKQAETMEAPIVQKQINAYKLIDEANRKIYTTYYKDLSQKYNSCPAKKKDIVDEYMGIYEEKWDDALNTIKKAPADKKADQKAVASILRNGTNIQNEAIDYQVKTYAELLGWYDKPEPVVEEVVEQEIISAAPAKPADRIHYKVQIAADDVPLDLEFIKTKVYNSNEVINNEYTNGTYRYLIGRYNTYEEAREARDRMNVKGAFIVEYKNGERQAEIHDDNNKAE